MPQNNDKIKKLFLGALVLMVVYMLLTRSGLLPEMLFYYPTKKLVKVAMAIAFASWGIWVYTRKKNTKNQK